MGELMTIVGFEDVSYKSLFMSDDSGGGGGGVGDGFDGFSDFLVWDAPHFLSLDDLIGSTNSEHDFQAMGVPSLPKVNFVISSSVSSVILIVFIFSGHVSNTRRGQSRAGERMHFLL